jgi:hypothetical protein
LPGTDCRKIALIGSDNEVTFIIPAERCSMDDLMALTGFYPVAAEAIKPLGMTDPCTLWS